jgi:hypothetical protein
LFICGAAAVALFAAGLANYEPFWESNDDSGMSMIAHGYGIGTTPSPLLLFENVLIGYLLQVLPTIYGVLPYSWFAMGLILVAGWALLYFVVRSGGALWLALFALALVYARIIAAPQFTITAGLLTAAGVLACFSYIRVPSLGALVAGAVLVVAGYLVRPEAAAFVMVIALPLVPWREISLKRAEIVTAVLTFGFVVFATVLDFQHYTGPEWASFRALDPLRVSLTDYSFAEYILKHPSQIHAHGFSKNDIQLISSWFYIDPKVADPARLQALIASLPTENWIAGNLFQAVVAVQALADPTIAPLMISAVIFSLLSRCWVKSIIAWLVFVSIIVLFGLVGRPAVLHTYYPIPILMLFASLERGLRPEVHKPMLRVIPWTVLIASLAMMLRVNIVENSGLRERSRLAREDVSRLDRNKTYVVWGAALPIELVFPVLERSTTAFDFPQYGLGWESLTPFALDSFKGSRWTDLVDRIAHDHDIPFVAGRGQIDLLSKYCNEHLHGQLAVREERLNTFTVFYVTCGPT